MKTKIRWNNANECLPIFKQNDVLVLTEDMQITSATYVDGKFYDKTQPFLRPSTSPAEWDSLNVIGWSVSRKTDVVA